MRKRKALQDKPYMTGYTFDRDAGTVTFQVVWTSALPAPVDYTYGGDVAPYHQQSKDSSYTYTTRITPGKHITLTVTLLGVQVAFIDAQCPTTFGPPFGNDQAFFRVDNNLGCFTMDDARRYGRHALEFHMEGEGHNFDMNSSDNPSQYQQAIFNMTAGETQWSDFYNNHRDYGHRAAAWGRPYEGPYSAVPFTWNVKCDGVWYEIPNLWMHMAPSMDPNQSNAHQAWMRSNWGQYDAFNFQQANKSMFVYGYQSGDRSKPWALQVSTVMAQKGAFVAFPMMQVRPLFAIPTTSSEAPDGFVAEFNWRLAQKRDDVAWALMKSDPDHDMDGWYGWVGRTGVDWASALTDAVGNTVDYGVDPIVWFPLESKDGVVRGSVKDIHLIQIDSQEAAPEYSQTFVVQNGMDNQQTVRTNDYAHATTDTMTWSWGFKWGMNQKVTIKWETDLGATIPFASIKAKFTLQVEYGFTEEWNEQQTHTVTDTKTFTMGGQNVTLPPKTAAKVEAVLMKVAGSGTVAKVVKITDKPDVLIAGRKNTVSIGWTTPVKGQVHLDKVCEALGMTSAKSGHTTQTGEQLDGLFVFPIMPFQVKFGASGAVNVYPEPYTPPPATMDNVVTISSGGK